MVINIDQFTFNSDIFPAFNLDLMQMPLQTAEAFVASTFKLLSDAKLGDDISVSGNIFFHKIV